MMLAIAFFKGLGVILSAIAIILAFFWGIEMAFGMKAETDMSIIDKVCLWFVTILFVGGFTAGLITICIKIGQSI